MVDICLCFSAVLDVAHDYDGTEEVLVDARRVDACVGKDRGLRERSDIAQEFEKSSLHIGMISRNGTTPLIRRSSGGNDPYPMKKPTGSGLTSRSRWEGSVRRY